MTTKTAASFLYGSVISAGLALLPFSTALAETATGTLGVSAQVVATCSVVDGGATLAFGEYNPIAARDGGISFFVHCTTHTPVSVSLGGGTGGDSDQRKMSDGTDVLNYDLYSDSDRSQPFGDGTNHGNSLPITGTPDAGTAVPVYGRIPAGQEVPTGFYNDSVEIALAF